MSDCGYPTTCFIDAGKELVGKLYLKNDVCINFSEKCIYVDNEKQNVAKSEIELLFAMIKKEGVVFAPETMYDIAHPGKTDYPDSLINMIRNFASKMNKYVDIQPCATGEAHYRVVLPQRIKEFDVRRQDVKSIKELFKGLKTEEEIAAEEAFNNVTGKFLHGGAKALLDGDREEILFAIEKLSKVFNLISTVQYADETLFKNTEPKSVVVDMYNYITKVCRNTDARNVLKIEGPLGSYKNRIMQYIYLMIRESDGDILPFYIDLAYYERLAEEEVRVTESDFIEMFRSDLAEFRKAIEEEPDRIPLLLLDGIRDFRRGNESVYNCISRELDETDCRIVACMDCDFTMNEKQKFSIHPLVPDEFEADVRISSMSLYNASDSISFIEKCREVFDVKIPANITAADIYSRLLKLNFVYIDAYWLVSMLRRCWRDIMSPYSNIARLYESLCLSVVTDYGTLDAAAEMAYNFEYGSRVFSTSNVYFDMCWRLIRKHRSILEYLIARWYMRRMSELNFERDSDEESLRKLSFFNMVIQKNVTRFVIAMLKGDDEYEHKIMVIARKFYNNLNLHGKCELAFWMGRLKDENRKAQCSELLKKFRDDALDMYENGKFERISEKRDAAFFLRSVNISLMYANDEDAFVYYLNSLLADKIANSVNRGFHLEYYGDKHYNPANSLLDYEDDITKGENTLTVLCLSIDERCKNEAQASYAAVLEIMTLCNLIQARLEVEAMYASRYFSRCMLYLGWVFGSDVLNKIPDVKNYFYWMANEFGRDLYKVPYHQSSVYNKFSQASAVERTGWVREGLSKPENIVEHMYNCWLIGMLYLPKEYNEPGYDKNTVLNMLLIHDLGETVTGDIARPDKEKNREAYDRLERAAMRDLLFSGTYPSAVDLSEYLGYWNEWDKKGAERGINALIAKDIDNLQTTYKFCDYYLKNPGLFDEKGVRYWLGDISIMKTQLGKKIMDTLVVSNPRFAEILAIIK